MIKMSTTSRATTTMNRWSRRAVSSPLTLLLAVLVLLVETETVRAFSPTGIGASSGLVAKKLIAVNGRGRKNIGIQQLSHPPQRKKRGDVSTSSLIQAARTDTRRSTASTSQLFSQSSDDSAKNGKKQNIKVLGKLSVSGLMAYGYMQYWAVVTFGSCAYYLFQKTVRALAFSMYLLSRHFSL